MEMRAYVAGVGMTRFGKFLDRGLKSLAAEAIEAALKDAGLDRGRIQAAYMGNAAASVITGQVLIPGEVVLRGMGIGRIPVVNVENACATSATAFHQAAAMITAGVYDVVLVTGFEKLHHQDKLRTFSVFQGAIDVEAAAETMAWLARKAAEAESATGAGTEGQGRSVFMDLYAELARSYMREYGATPRHFAMVSAKNSVHGSLNPKAQYQKALTVQDVLAAPMVVDPLTLTMCSPIGDGAAAIVLVSERTAAELGLRDRVRVLSSVLASGWDHEPAGDDLTAVEYAARAAYETGGVGPDDLDVVELHDASSPAELVHYEYLGLAPKGEGVRLVEDGDTRVGGRIPVNTSGGLLRKGHPIGASGAGQIVELADQLRGRCGARQVAGARTALAENGGGFVGGDVGAIVVSVLRRESR
ncbi:thiolase family protein [Spirillospora sp. NPDC048823]|uniref:thiolase family protein n=1 Tax=unclassified Spirillospora TaxID=2642701 RepID=UPI00371EBB0D